MCWIVRDNTARVHCDLALGLVPNATENDLKGSEDILGGYTFAMLLSPGIVAGIMVLWKKFGYGHPPAISPQAWLASRLEERAFRLLSVRYPCERYLISAHMLLVDVVGRQHLPQLAPLERRFAWRAHCDFVIVERSSLTIIRVIEVNGAYHDDRYQQELDQRKRRLLAQFGIPLETLGYAAVASAVLTAPGFLVK